jgi:NRPS condensation-like uncharacterized protein
LGGTQHVPFTEFDEAIMHLEQHAAPWNVQLEVGASGRLDPSRIEGSLRRACAVHPMLRARRDDFSSLDVRYRWAIPEELERIPFEVTDVGSSDELRALRTRFYSPRLDLEESPPWRALLARRQDGTDLLMLNVSHVAADGIGSLRFARAVTTTYAGGQDRPPDVDLRTARDLSRHVGASDPREWRARMDEAKGRLVNLVDDPTRISAEGGDGTDGFGFVHRVVDDETLERLLQERPEGASVNDLLLAALHLTVAEWNGARDEDAERIPVMVPMNARPEDWRWDVVGNYAPLATVSTTPEERRDRQAAISAIAEQTNRLKRHQRGAHLYDLLRWIVGLPLGMKRRMPALLDLTGGRFVDSAVLSNLGRVPEMPSFEDLGAPPPELWFSPPCRMPLGVGIGAATVGGTLFLVVRHRFEQFDTEAAARFADRFVGTLTDIVDRPDGQ